ncbi:MAG: tetratricopeptide repeat protein, partial [Halobacteriota archaeon]|nr:tetratricopeptide repeat protein [Halobacteriota archaeon]
MPVIYQAEFRYDEAKGKEKIILIWTGPEGTQKTDSFDSKDIKDIEVQCHDLRWDARGLSQQIGKKLFDILDGDDKRLIGALKEADDYGETLQLHIRSGGLASKLPFELLYHGDFLVPSRIHLVRRVSDRGIKKKPKPENRPLKILFMACSPRDTYPALHFEKEEEEIFKIAKDLPVEIDVEGTGSLEGLGERLVDNKYDIVHITGHADIGKDGKPVFFMEDEEGFHRRVTPSKLQETLSLNLPGLVFLSGCRTGETPLHAAAVSFADHLVLEGILAVLSWGLPVSDVGASIAAEVIYFDLSRGENILEAVNRSRKELLKYHKNDWSLLRLFCDGTPLNVALVERGQKKLPKKRDLQHKYLVNSQVKVLKEGFVGRRWQIQQGIRCLKSDEEKVGLLLHGTGGLGKSCLAGKLCERFKDHTLIIVHGKLNTVTFYEALKDAFFRGGDDKASKMLEARDEKEKKEDISGKIRSMCSSVFQESNYLILFDDFEKNLSGISGSEDDDIKITQDAEPILETLLKFLPYSGKMTQLIITSRYTFPITFEGKDLVCERLESIGLTSFRGADEVKKAYELKNIPNCEDHVKQQLIEAGRGNPRLMEALDTLVGNVKGLDIDSLLSKVKGKKDEFVQDLVLNEILKAQPEDLQNLLHRSAVYRLPVHKKGIENVSFDLADWESHLDKAVHISLIEADTTLKNNAWYFVSPLLREDIFCFLDEGESVKCHKGATSYYQEVLSSPEYYNPLLAEELIEHALRCGEGGIAIEEGAKLLSYLRLSLAYDEALTWGEYILSQIQESKKDEKYALFISELAAIHHYKGGDKKALGYFEEALSIDKEVYGERHPNVARDLNNIGGEWRTLGDPKKAIEYYEQALSIDKKVYGDRHPSVATDLNNIGMAWYSLGNPKKAIEYYKQALSIDEEVYGERHPNVARDLNNIGGAWRALGEVEKAIEYYKQALSIDKEVYGERHPNVARDLNNIGGAWRALGEGEKAI